MKHAIYRLFIATLLAAMLVPSVAFQGGQFASGVPGAAAAGNPIVTENQQPGSTGWQISVDATLTPLEATNHEIEGYASLSSVNKGSTIDFKVSLSSAAQFTMDIYRMGYYGGAGGRLMQSVGPLSGAKQAACARTTTTTNFGLTECNWNTSYTLTVPTTWTTGNYLVKLRRSDTRLEKYMTFVVRDDAGVADIVHSMDVSTWQAYNFWGGSDNGNIGYNLYGKFFDHRAGTHDYDNISSERAHAVSLDRPYTMQGETDGAGGFFIWDYPMVRWMESQGYNVTYATSVDLETNPSLLSGRKALINTGHDEYYSDGMRANVQAYINGGAHMGFFSANNFYFRILWDANPANGQQYRRIICYKSSALDSVTLRWRDLSPPQPENAIGGVMLGGLANDRPFRVYDASHWIFAGTGLVNYVSGTPVTSGTGQNAIAGIVGYEFDARARSDASLSSFISAEPANIQQVGHSAVPAVDNGTASFSDATVYTATSGALVFSAGTLQWSWGLDSGYNSGSCGCNPGYVDPKLQQSTKNIIDRFISTQAGGGPAVALSPASLTFASQQTGTTSGAQTVTLTNSGGAALTISGIAIAGANAGDFAQTNGCPATLPAAGAGQNSCTISVTFTPSAVGSRTATLTITDNATGSPHTVALSGAGTATSSPTVALSPASLTFASQTVNTASGAQAVTLTNSGTAALTISSISIGGSVAGDFAQTNTCPASPATLPAAGAGQNSCTISVTFTPSAVGSRTATLSVADNAEGSPHTVALSGTGALPAGTYLVDGFEGGLGGWTSIGTGSATAQAATINSGARAAALTVTSGQFVALTANLTAPQAQTYTRFCFRLSGLSGSTVLAQGRAVNGNTMWEVDYNAPRGGLDIYVWNGGGNGAGTRTDLFTANNLVTQNFWYCAEVRLNQATQANGGRAEVWLNGTSVAAVDADLSATSLYSAFYLHNQAIGTTYVDDIRVANTGAGPVGAGAAPLPTPAASLSPASLTFASQQTGTTSAPQTVTLTNSGGAALTISGIAIAGANAGDFAQTNTCPATLAAGGSCTINVTFAPAAAGSRAGTLTITDNATGSPHTVALAGTGTMPPSPAVTLAPTGLTFAGQLVGSTSAAQPVTLTNSGTAPLTIASIAVTGANAGDFAQTNTCPASPATLAAGANCTISVTFAPGWFGTRTASLSIADNATGSPHTLPLAGTGTLPAGTYLTDGFEGGLGGWVAQGTGSAATQTGVINAGTAAAVLSDTSGQFVVIASDLTAPQAQTYTRFCFNLSGLSGSTVLARGRDVNGNNLWEVDYDAGLKGLDFYFWNGNTRARTDLFSPANVVSLNTWYCAEVQMNQAAAGHGEVWLNGTSVARADADLSATNPYSRLVLSNEVTGAIYFDDVKVANTYNGPTGAGATPLAAPAVSFSPASLTFASQSVGSTSAAQTVTLTNSGNAALTIGGIAITGANAGDFAQTNTCPASPATLAAGANCTVNVTFTPGATGSRGASLSVTDNAAGSPHTVALAGTGVASAVALSPTSLTFGNQPVGTTSAAQTVTLTNSGTAPLTIASIAVTGANAGDFARTSACPVGPATLAAGANCAISVTFAPTAAGSRAGTLTITDNAAGSPHTVALSGTGVAPAVSFSPASLTFASQQTGTTSAPQSVTLTNSGSAALTITSLGLTGANAGDFAQTNNCPLSPTTMAPGAFCTINVTFAPAWFGTRTASLSIADNATGSPHTVALSGTGALQAGTYLNDGFERGFAGWTVTGTGSATIQTTTARAGSAARLNNTSGQFVGLYADLAGGAQTQTNTRFYVNVGGLNATTILAQGRNANGTTLWEVDYDFASKGLDIYFWNGAGTRFNLTNSSNLFTSANINQWHWIEVQVNEIAGGSAQVWFDGKNVGQLNNRDLSVAAGAYSRLFLWNNPAVGSVYFDDVVVANKPKDQQVGP